MKKYFVFLTATVLIIATAAISSCKKKEEEPQIVSVAAQSGELTAGKPGTLTFPVTTGNIGKGEYTVSVTNLPSGISVKGKISIDNNGGTLTLEGNASTVKGVYASLTLNIDKAISNKFTLTIGEEDLTTTPAAPGSFVVTAGNAQVVLEWTTPENGGSPITKYQASHGATTGYTADWKDIASSGATTVTHTVTGLTNNTQFTFEVRAVNAKGQGASSGTKTETPSAPLFAGKGESDDPYLITNANDLVQLRIVVNDHISPYSNERKYFRQTADISLPESAWTPIGSNQKSFTGSYDGGGFSISNLTISGSSYAQGLFGEISRDGTVKNIALPNVNITNENNDTGGVAGVNSGRIVSCYVSGNISGNSRVGGVTGTNNGTVENCYTTCNVTGRSDYVGGIAGVNSNAYGIHEVKNCYATGAIVGKTSVGGVAGANSGSITNCVALNFLVAKTDNSNADIGRVAGSKYGVQVNNYARTTGMAVLWNYNGDAGNELEVVPGASTVHGDDVDELDYHGSFATSWWNIVPVFKNYQTMDEGVWLMAKNRLPHLGGFSDTTPQNPKIIKDLSSIFVNVVGQMEIENVNNDYTRYTLPAGSKATMVRNLVISQGDVLTVSGELTINAGVTLEVRRTAIMKINADGKVTGAGTLNKAAAGAGYVNNGTVDVANIF